MFKIEITDTFVKVTHSNRADEQIEWNDIEEISLVTSDEGLLLPDVWLLLKGKESGCSFPQEAEGWEQVYDIISEYEGFNFENMIESTSCVENKEFELWKK